MLKYYLQWRNYFRTSLIQIKELLFMVQCIFVALNHCFSTVIFLEIFSVTIKQMFNVEKTAL